MIIETIFAGRNNTFSLQLVRGEQAINLLSVTGYELTLSNGRVFSTTIDEPTDFFVEKDDGIVEINIGSELTVADDLGSHTAYLVTFDPINVDGVRWPNFKLKVR